MPKKKEKDSSEFYRGEIRKLRKEVQQLRRELNKYHPSQDDEEVSHTEDTHPKVYRNREPCESCGKDSLRTFEIIGRVFEECTTPGCGYRKKISGP